MPLVLPGDTITQGTVSSLESRPFFRPRLELTADQRHRPSKSVLLQLPRRPSRVTSALTCQLGLSPSPVGGSSGQARRRPSRV